MMTLLFEFPLFYSRAVREVNGVDQQQGNDHFQSCNYPKHCLDRLRPRPSDNDDDNDDDEAQIDHLGPQAPPTRPLKFLQQMAQPDHQKPIYESHPDQS